MTEDQSLERCVGCGAAFPRIDGPIHRYMTSSPGCWAHNGEVSGVLAIKPHLRAARQMCVDAYAVQHPGTPNPQAIQSVVVHLLNMYDYLVCGRPVTPPRLAGHKGVFHWLLPPASRGTRTVLDMPVTGSDNEIAVASRLWAESAWAVWAEYHAQIATWHARYATSVPGTHQTRR
jgi:hypothetical protein